MHTQNFLSIRIDVYFIANTLSMSISNLHFNYTMLRWKIHFQCVLLERTSTRIIPELHSFRNQFLHKHNNFIVSIKCWAKCWRFQWKQHNLRHRQLWARKRPLTLDFVNCCCVHATCCVKLKPEKRKTETTETKQPKQNETLMYYVLRPLYSLLRPLYSVLRPLQTAWDSYVNRHKSIAKVVH